MQTETSQTVARVPIRLILPNPLQPRRHFDEEEMEDLTASIKEHGVLQMPLLRTGAITPEGERGYYLIAGERRVRASERAGYYEIDAVIREVTSLQAGILAGVENLLRSNLSPLEEADMILGLQAASEDAGEPFNPATLAQTLGKGRGVGWIANRVDLAGMGADVQEMVKTRPDSLVHARAVDRVPERDRRSLLIEFTLSGASYRALDELTRYLSDAGRGATPEGLRDLVEFYFQRDAFLRKNPRPFVQRVDEAIRRDNPVATPSAPDAQTQSRAQTNARTGGGNVSRGQEVTGESAHDAKRELDARLLDARAALQSALNWKKQLPKTNIEAELRAIRALLDSLEAA